MWCGEKCINDTNSYSEAESKFKYKLSNLLNLDEGNQHETQK